MALWSDMLLVTPRLGSVSKFGSSWRFLIFSGKISTYILNRCTMEFNISKCKFTSCSDVRTKTVDGSKNITYDHVTLSDVDPPLAYGRYLHFR